MIENFIAIYVLIDDTMLEIGHKEPVNRNSSDSELIAVALMAAKYFRDNIDHAISFVKCTNLLPGCYHNIDGMKNMFFDLPEDSIVYDESAYTDYYNEEVCRETAGITLRIAGKSNSKMPHEPRQNFMITDSRKRIETTLSQISRMLPKRIHAVTVDGLMKVIFFIFVYTINEIT
jgi:hypothetical protein